MTFVRARAFGHREPRFPTFDTSGYDVMVLMVVEMMNAMAVEPASLVVAASDGLGG